MSTKDIESDVELNESIASDDQASIVTDDEFYNELMSTTTGSANHHLDYLIPDGCTDEKTGIEHLIVSLNGRYESSPVIFVGTLQDAIDESFHSKERRPLLIYINNDKSVYTNIFCQQLLCHERIIEFLLNNYILWAWDVTFPSNAEKLNEICQTVFSQWHVDRMLGTKRLEDYPLLIGIFHEFNGDCSLKYLIRGLTNQSNVDEFLAYLIEYKDQFYDTEERFEREKSRPHQRNGLFSTSDFPPLSNHHLPNPTLNRNPFQIIPFVTGVPNQFSMSQRIGLINAFRQMSIQANERKAEEKQTPTIEYPSPE